MTDETVFLRQIHPSFLQSEVVSSQAFCPTEAHNWQLSLYDGDMIEAEAAWIHYTSELKKESLAVMGLAQVECAELSLTVIPSPEEFAEHCHIDFEAFTRKEREKKARKLRDCAAQRGILFPPEV